MDCKNLVNRIGAMGAMDVERQVLRGLVLALLLPWTAAVQAQSDEEDAPLPMSERPVLRANPLTSGFSLDGQRGDPAWRDATDSIPDLTTVEPDEGEVPAAPTIIKVFANPDEIVVLAWCRDREPERIVSFSKARDSNLDEEDHLTIVFDTFMDSRSGYVFRVNPSGARFDGLVPRHADEVNSSWDAIWEAKTSRDETGWYAEIRIPVKSLSFEKGLETWGFNIERRVERLLEVSRWSGVSLDYEVTQPSRAGLLSGLPHLDYGLGLSVRPAFVTNTRNPGPGKDIDFDADVALDVTQKVTSNLLAALTVNTDFAETEVDVRQINLTRFEIFFPEKRSFFLEGSDIFEFGVGLDEESLVPFHSRRIGLIGLNEEEQSEVPINAGGKINGRLGNTNLGALVVNTRKTDSLQLDETVFVNVPQTTMGAFRVSQNVLDESSVGVIATFGDQQNRSNSWMAGADFTFETSSFRGEKNFLVGAWGLLNDREDLNGDKSAWGARVDYPNDLWDINLTSTRIGDGFDPSLSFLVRNNVHIWDFGMEFNPRPQWPWVRQMFHELSFQFFNKLDNSEWESYSFTIKPIDWLLESGDKFDISIEPEGDRPPEIFEISADTDMLNRSYEWVRYVFGARAAERRSLSGEVRLETGTYYNGDMNALEARLTWKPSALLALEATGEWARGEVQALIDDYDDYVPPRYDLVEKSFKEQVFGFRLNLNFSSDLQFSSLTQYDTEGGEFGTNNRLRWTFDPLGDLFVVFNHNEVREVPFGSTTGKKEWRFVSNELPIKVQYALRF